MTERLRVKITYLNESSDKSDECDGEQKRKSDFMKMRLDGSDAAIRENDLHKASTCVCTWFDWDISTSYYAFTCSTGGIALSLTNGSLPQPAIFSIQQLSGTVKKYTFLKIERKFPTTFFRGMKDERNRHLESEKCQEAFLFAFDVCGFVYCGQSHFRSRVIIKKATTLLPSMSLPSLFVQSRWPLGPPPQHLYALCKTSQRVFTVSSSLYRSS